MFSFPLLIIIYAGFTHAFEADHLLAVSNIVSQRNSTWSSAKDGIFWGLGHASALFVIGVLAFLFKISIAPKYFNYFEAIIGCALIVLAVYRLIKFFGTSKIVIHAHQHLHMHVKKESTHQNHSLAYTVGLFHGLAGSGTLIVLVMSQVKTSVEGLVYLIIFGAGCIGGMLLAARLFSIPFSKKIMQAQRLQRFLILASSFLCLFYGSRIMYENLAF